MFSERIKDFLIKRPIRINKENEHKVILRRGFLAALLYSIFYGFFEYFIVYNNYVGLLRIYANIFGAEQTLGGAIINWSIMYGCLLITVAIATYYNKKLNFEQILMGLLFMTMLEDFIYWVGQWIETGQYPFPAPNWWDNTFASFRILGGLGKPIPFWPYVPQYYIPGFGMVAFFYIMSYLGPKASRIAFIIICPLFIAILAGTFSTEFFALIVLIVIPLISYIYCLLLLAKNNWNLIEA